MAVDNNEPIDAATTVEAGPQPNIFSRAWRTIGHFLREVQVELKKTSWPTRDELTKFTIVVLVTIIAVAVFLFVGDQIIALIAHYLFGSPSSGGLPVGP